MKARSKGNGKIGRGSQASNLRALCWQAGFEGVSGLANVLGVHRGTVSRAWRWPDQFGPTYRRMKEALGR